MTIRVVALVLLAALSTVPPPAAAEPDIKEVLEGIWIEGRAPDKGVCIAARYDGETQLEFEFRKSGGRVMVFEPPDLFQALQIAKIERDSDAFTLTARTRDGVENPIVRLRVLDHARIETVSLVLRDGGAPQAPVIAYRCGAPNRAGGTPVLPGLAPASTRRDRRSGLVDVTMPAA